MSTIIAIVVEKYHMMVRVTEVIMIAKALDVGNVMIVIDANDAVKDSHGGRHVFSKMYEFSENI